MAALPYMQLYIADYLADTMHLSTEEHGAYLLLMFNYWQTGKAIPKNRLAKIARMSDERWQVIEGTLSEFFDDDGEQWIHLRIENDLEKISTSPRGKKLPGGDTLSGYKGYVYFMTSPDIDTVKVGYSKNPWARISEVRRSYGSNYGSSIAVVATVKTVDKSESSVHGCLADFRKEGEWFFKNDCIESLISSISAGNITTVVDICNYVVNYGSATNNYETPTTATTNTDTDTDIKEDKNILSGAEKNQHQTSEPVFISLPLADGVSFFEVTESYLREQLNLYPGINIEQEFRNMCGWLNSNPKKRKTGRGIKRFITTWLQRSQDQPRSFYGGNTSVRDVNRISEPDNTIPPGFRG